jgi:hypothetical protein
MSDSQGSEDSDDMGSHDTPLYLSPEPEPTVTLAKIFISHDAKSKYVWTGKEPVVGDQLFVYAYIGDAIYSSYMPRIYLDKPDYLDFTKMHSGPYDTFKGVSYLHSKDGSIILPLMQGAHLHSRPEQSNCRIYQDNDTTTFWYKLCDDCYGHDRVISTIVHDSIRPIRLSEIGNPCSIDKKYTPFCGYLPGECLFLFKRECNQTYKPLKGNTLKGISKNTKKRNLSRSLRRGGGKTRRKFKVKKRRNRRIRNTMKRRKTALKRRK